MRENKRKVPKAMSTELLEKEGHVWGIASFQIV